MCPVYVIVSFFSPTRKNNSTPKNTFAFENRTICTSNIYECVSNLKELENANLVIATVCKELAKSI